MKSHASHVLLIKKQLKFSNSLTFHCLRIVARSRRDFISLSFRFLAAVDRRKQAASGRPPKAGCRKSRNRVEREEGKNGEATD